MGDGGLSREKSLVEVLDECGERLDRAAANLSDMNANSTGSSLGVLPGGLDTSFSARQDTTGSSLGLLPGGLDTSFSGRPDSTASSLGLLGDVNTSFQSGAESSLGILSNLEASLDQATDSLDAGGSPIKVINNLEMTLASALASLPGGPSSPSPRSRSPSPGLPTTHYTQYSIPSAHYTPDMDYSVPSAQYTPDMNYSVPSAHYTPDMDYSVPSAQYTPDMDYSVPSARYTPDMDYSVPSARYTPPQLAKLSRVEERITSPRGRRLEFQDTSITIATPPARATPVGTSRPVAQSTPAAVRTHAAVRSPLAQSTPVMPMRSAMRPAGPALPAQATRRVSFVAGLPDSPRPSEGPATPGSRRGSLGTSFGSVGAGQLSWWDVGTSLHSGIYRPSFRETFEEPEHSWHWDSRYSFYTTGPYGDITKGSGSDTFDSTPSLIWDTDFISSLEEHDPIEVENFLYTPPKPESPPLVVPALEQPLRPPRPPTSPELHVTIETPTPLELSVSPGFLAQLDQMKTPTDEELEALERRKPIGDIILPQHAVIERMGIKTPSQRERWWKELVEYDLERRRREATPEHQEFLRKRRLADEEELRRERAAIRRAEAQRAEKERKEKERWDALVLERQRREEQERLERERPPSPEYKCIYPRLPEIGEPGYSSLDAKRVRILQMLDASRKQKPKKKYPKPKIKPSTSPRSQLCQLLADPKTSKADKEYIRRQLSPTDVRQLEAEIKIFYGRVSSGRTKKKKRTTQQPKQIQETADERFKRLLADPNTTEEEKRHMLENVQPNLSMFPAMLAIESEFLYGDEGEDDEWSELSGEAPGSPERVRPETPPPPAPVASTTSVTIQVETTESTESSRRRIKFNERVDEQIIPAREEGALSYAQEREDAMISRFGTAYPDRIPRTASTYRPGQSPPSPPPPPTYRRPQAPDEPMYGPFLPWTFGSNRPPPRTAAGRIPTECPPAAPRPRSAPGRQVPPTRPGSAPRAGQGRTVSTPARPRPTSTPRDRVATPAVTRTQMAPPASARTRTLQTTQRTRTVPATTPRSQATTPRTRTLPATTPRTRTVPAATPRSQAATLRTRTASVARGQAAPPRTRMATPRAVAATPIPASAQEADSYIPPPVSFLPRGPRPRRSDPESDIDPIRGRTMLSPVAKIERRLFEADERIQKIETEVYGPVPEDPFPELDNVSPEVKAKFADSIQKVKHGLSRLQDVVERKLGERSFEGGRGNWQ